MTRPLTRIKHYHQRATLDRYDQIALLARQKWYGILLTLPEGLSREENLVRRIGELVASRARLLDKFNLVRQLVSDGVDSPDGTLPDDDVLVILAGWVAERTGDVREEEE